MAQTGSLIHQYRSSRSWLTAEPAKGYTLAELMVAFAIALIIMAAVLMVFISGQRSWRVGDAVAGLREDMIRAVRTMEKELSVTGPSVEDLALGATANSITFSIPQDLDADGVVVNAASQVEWSAPITYSLNGASRQIERTTGGVTTVLAAHVSALQFSRLSDRIIRVDVTVRRTPYMVGMIDDVEQFTVKIRN
jgi:Tfp pilus assembly protein PilW